VPVVMVQGWGADQRPKRRPRIRPISGAWSGRTERYSIDERAVPEARQACRRLTRKAQIGDHTVTRKVVVAR